MKLTLAHLLYIHLKSLTHWGRVMHVCASKLIITGSDDGFLPGRRKAIIWTNDGILLIGPLRTKFSDILIEIHTFSFKEMHLKMLSPKWWPFHLGLNVLKDFICVMHIYQLGAITETTIWVHIFKSSHCNSVEDWALVDFIYRCAIVIWVAETGLDYITEGPLLLTWFNLNPSMDK